MLGWVVTIIKPNPPTHHKLSKLATGRLATADISWRQHTFKTLEKEHRDLVNLYDKTKGAYFNQADEKQVLQYKVQELDEHKTNQAK